MNNCSPCTAISRICIACIAIYQSETTSAPTSSTGDCIHRRHTGITVGITNSISFAPTRTRTKVSIYMRTCHHHHQFQQSTNSIHRIASRNLPDFSRQSPRLPAGTHRIAQIPQFPANLIHSHSRGDGATRGLSHEIPRVNEAGNQTFPPTPAIPAGNDASEKEQNLALRHGAKPTANAALVPAVF